MGGCCCYAKDDDQQDEKCVIVKSEEPQSPRKEYGSLSTMEDKQELYYEEPKEPDKLLEKYEERDGSTTSSQSEEEQFSEAHSSTNGDPGDESQVGVTLQEQPSSAGPLSTQEDVAAESETMDREQSDVDREIDELVAAAMATKVIYPPSAPQQETSLSHPAEAASSTSDPPPSPRALQDPSPDQEADSDQEANPTKRVSFIRRTQRSIKRAKARAASMVSSPSKHKDGEQAEKQSGSFKEKKTKAPTTDESTSKREAQRTLSGKDREDLLAKSESRRLKGSAPGERMKSRYAKDRMSKLGVERDVRAKIAARRSANDPRKAALERGERLGQLDDRIEEMRDHSSSFAQVARQLKEEQRSRTTSFPW